MIESYQLEVDELGAMKLTHRNSVKTWSSPYTLNGNVLGETDNSTIVISNGILTLE